MDTTAKLNRRDFVIRCGTAATIAGLSSSHVDASTNTIRGERRNIIMVVLCGGLSQLDSFDHKPKAPREMRGVFDACATRTGDAIFSELFPNLAAINAVIEATVATLREALDVPEGYTLRNVHEGFVAPSAPTEDNE
jgi:uncharacterized protein (DUF1501 family)